MTKEKIVVGIDAGSSRAKVVVAKVAQEGNKKVSVILGTGSAPSEAVRRGFVESTADLAQAIGIAVKQAEKNSGIKIRRAEISAGDAGLLGMTATATTIVSRADSEITELDYAKTLEISEEALPASFTQNRMLLHKMPVASRIDGQQIFTTAIGSKGAKLESKNLFIGAIETNIQKLVSAVEANDIEISNVSASPIASSLAILTKSQKIAGCILVDIGAETTSVIMYENNMPLSVEILPLGGQDITNDIALGFKISIEEAESIKIGAMTQGDFSKKKLDDMIRARLSDIFDLIENHLKKYGKSRMLPAGIILTGGGSKIIGLETFARDYLKLPAKIGVAPSGIVGKNTDPAFSVGYGLCLLAAADDEPRMGGFSQTRSKVFGWLKQFLP